MCRIAQEMSAAVLHVTHDPVDAMQLADRVVVLEKGRISQTGTPAVLRESPATEFVARVVAMGR